MPVVPFCFQRVGYHPSIEHAFIFTVTCLHFIPKLYFPGAVFGESTASGALTGTGRNVMAARNYRFAIFFSRLKLCFLRQYVVRPLCFPVPQTRSRPMNVYAQFEGAPCSGGRTETRSCQTTKGCPLQDGCGNRFRCRSGTRSWWLQWCGWKTHSKCGNS